MTENTTETTEPKVAVKPSSDANTQAESGAAEDKSHLLAPDSIDSSPSQQNADPQTTYKPVDIMVYGKVYTINCPVGEEPALRQAGKHINSFVQTVRKQSPQLSQEELLVLCCLDMYETLQEIQNKETKQDDDEQKALNLIDKMINDAQNMIN